MGRKDVGRMEAASRQPTNRYIEGKAIMPEFTNGYWRSETDFKMTFVVTGAPAVLKNSQTIGTRGKKPILVPNPRAKQWHEIAVKQLSLQWPFKQPIPIEISVHAQIVTYAQDRRRRDLDNSLSGPLDALKAPMRSALGKLKKSGANILSDDSQVKSLDGSRLWYDADNPRVEITLRHYTEWIDPDVSIAVAYGIGEVADPEATRNYLGGE